MNLEVSRPQPCGECANCKLAAEVQKCLEFVDRRFAPELERLAHEITSAKWSGSDAALESLSRSFRRWKAQWVEARERFLTPDVLHAVTCPITLSVIVYRKPDSPAPEVTAKPRELELEAQLELARSGHCLRCGRDLNYTPAALGVCNGCFGKEP